MGVGPVLEKLTLNTEGDGEGWLIVTANGVISPRWEGVVPDKIAAAKMLII